MLQQLSCNVDISKLHDIYTHVHVNVYTDTCREGLLYYWQCVCVCVCVCVVEDAYIVTKPVQLIVSERMKAFVKSV